MPTDSPCLVSPNIPFENETDATAVSPLKGIQIFIKSFYYYYFFVLSLILEATNLKQCIWIPKEIALVHFLNSCSIAVFQILSQVPWIYINKRKKNIYIYIYIFPSLSKFLTSRQHPSF